MCFLAGTLGQGGAERQLFYMLKALREWDAEVRVLCLTSGEFWEDRLRKLDVTIEWVGKSPSRLARLMRIVSILRRERPNIVQSQHFYVNPYAAAAARITGTRSIGAIRSDMWNELHGGDELLRKWGLKHCYMLAANSQPAIRAAVELGIPDHKLTFLPNVVDTDEFTPDEGQSSAIEFTVASVGRLVPSKRHDRLLSVIAQLKQLCPIPVKLLIAGDGPCRADIEEQVDALGLRFNVEFLGSRADLTKVYRSANALLVTSDYEGTPNVVLEAMACGLPVVASKVGGIPDIVEHGVNGFLSEPGDDDTLAVHLCALQKRPDLRAAVGVNARLHIQKHYSLKRLPQYLGTLYATVLSN